MTWRAAAIAVAALALQAPPALAGTVSVSGGVLTFDASPGETNNVTVFYSQDDNAFQAGDTNPITTGAGCATGDRGVSCPATGVTAVAVNLGDGDDRGDAEGLPVPVVVHGGPGNDELDGEGTLFGDEGDDYLVGSQHAETFTGGPGLDAIEADRIDTIDCQGGADDVVKPSAKPKLVNCPGAPSVAVTVSHVSVKQFLAGKLKLTIHCSVACAYRFFIKATPRLKRLIHHGGDNIEARPISLDDGGFLKLAGTWRTNAYVNGLSTAKALGRMHRFTVNLIVQAYTGQNAATTKTLTVQIG
jgi:hypothetical protein